MSAKNSSQISKSFKESALVTSTTMNIPKAKSLVFQNRIDEKFVPSTLLTIRVNCSSSTPLQFNILPPTSINFTLMDSLLSCNDDCSTSNVCNNSA